MEKYTEETLTSTPFTGPVAPSQQEVPPSITETEMKKMKVTQLRQELKNRGLSNHGLKPALLERLQKAVKDQVPLVAEQNTEKISTQAHFFDEKAFWKKIEPSNVAQDPLNNTPFREPTENAESSGVRNPHRIFSVKFD